MFPRETDRVPQLMCKDTECSWLHLNRVWIEVFTASSGNAWVYAMMSTQGHLFSCGPIRPQEIGFNGAVPAGYSTWGTGCGVCENAHAMQGIELVVSFGMLLSSSRLSILQFGAKEMAFCSACSQNICWRCPGVMAEFDQFNWCGLRPGTLLIL